MPNGRKPGEKPPETRPKQRGSKPRMTLEERRQLKAERNQTKAATQNADGGVHVARIMPPDPSAFPPKLLRAIQYYLDIEPRDVARAAQRGNMTLDEFKAYLKTPGVKEYLKQQEDLIDVQVANMRARARILTEDHLDAITADMLDSVFTPAAVRAQVLNTGYKRFGMLKDKVEATGAGGAPIAFELIRIGGRKTSESDV